jgi:hypothetical protein
LASEEARIDTPRGGELVAQALEAIARASDPDLEAWARYAVAKTRAAERESRSRR